MNTDLIINEWNSVLGIALIKAYRGQHLKGKEKKILKLKLDKKAMLPDHLFL